MKKPAIILSGLLLITLFSCKQEYSCYCTPTNGEIMPANEEEVRKDTKEKAKDFCNAQSNEVQSCKAVFFKKNKLFQ